MTAYNFTFTQLVPNSSYTILGFVMICHSLGVTPTLRLWRNMAKLVKIPDTEDNDGGWWGFQWRKGYKMVQKMPTTQKNFRRQFVMAVTGVCLSRGLERDHRLV